MKTKVINRYKLTDEDGNLVESVIWKVPVSQKYPHGIRYRLIFIPFGESKPRVLYDNHHPKGHHKHVGGDETPYNFVTVRQLEADFNEDVFRFKQRRGE